MNFDDNAALPGTRFEETCATKDEEDPPSSKPPSTSLNLYPARTARIGCKWSNGARHWPMATMDIVSLHGGAPANFLDVWRRCRPRRGYDSLQRIILSDPKCRRHSLVHHFRAAIMRVVTVNCAEGHRPARAREVSLQHVPLVVRLRRLQNVDLGKKFSPNPDCRSLTGRMICGDRRPKRS